MLCVCAVESWGRGSKSDVAGSCDATHAGKPRRTPSHAATSPGGAPADSESVIATMVGRGRKVRGGTVTFLFCLRVELLLKTDSGYPKDFVCVCVVVKPRKSLFCLPLLARSKTPGSHSGRFC